MLRLMLLVAAVVAAVHLPGAVAVSGRSAGRHRLEVQRHLKRLNKQAFTSINVCPFFIVSPSCSLFQ